MNKNDCKLLGTLSKPHGYKGHMVLIAENSLPDDFESWESVFVEIDGLLVPFFLEEVNHNFNDSAIIQFEDLGNIDLIAELLHCQVYAPLKQFRRKRSRSFEITDLKGFQVIDNKYGNIGIVDEVVDYNQNLVLSIVKDKKEILIPAQEPIIEKIDKVEKIIYINAPEGLIDIYLV